MIDLSIWKKEKDVIVFAEGLYDEGYRLRLFKERLHHAQSATAKTKELSYFGGDAAYHYIRCRLTANEYDVLPKIGLITVNCIEVVQTDTLCKNLEYIYNGESEIILDCYLTKNDLITVTVECEGQFVSWFHLTPNDNDLCGLPTGENLAEKNCI